MTEELKKKAEEWVKENCCEWCVNADECKQGCIDCHGISGYIAGAKENGIQWHDLRKDPNDLPPKENDVYSKEVRVCLGAGRYMHSVFSYALKEDGCKHCWVGCDPIAWCEEPQFKE